jgi:hypothetical protein
MQVAYATQYELSPFEWLYPEFDSPEGYTASNAVYHHTTGKIAEVSNKLCESVAKEVAE